MIRSLDSIGGRPVEDCCTAVVVIVDRRKMVQAEVDDEDVPQDFLLDDRCTWLVMRGSCLQWM